MIAKPLAFPAIKKGISLVGFEDINIGLKFGENSSPPYFGVEGVVTGLNAGYWVNVVSEGPNYVTIKNIVDASRYEDDEPRIQEVTQDIERDLIYPLLRGRDVARWTAKPSKFVIIPSTHGQIIPVKEMQLNYRLAYSYFNKLFDDLVNRGGEPYHTKLAP